MIVPEAELRTVLGLLSSITDEERGVLSLIHAQAESLVINYLGYDPEQRSVTEYYPRALTEGSPTDYRWGVTSDHRSAIPVAVDGARSLQLARLPVRAVSGVWVDSSARFGDRSNSFPDSTQWTQGEEFWVSWEDDYYCPSGILLAYGSWPIEPGTVKVSYVAGYSPAELLGRSRTTTSDDGQGHISTAGVNASGISRAVAVTVAAGMHKWSQLKKSSALGWVGPVKSEKLGDYSYTAETGAAISSLSVALTPEAEECLEPFVNYGALLRA